MNENRFLLTLVKWIMPSVIVILICLIAFLKPTPKAPGVIEGIVKFKSNCPVSICNINNVEIVAYRFGGKVIVAKTAPDTTGHYALTLPPATYVLDAKLENATSSDVPREVRLNASTTESISIVLTKTN